MEIDAENPKEMTVTWANLDGIIFNLLDDQHSIGIDDFFEEDLEMGEFLKREATDQFDDKMNEYLATEQLEHFPLQPSWDILNNSKNKSKKKSPKMYSQDDKSKDERRSVDFQFVPPNFEEPKTRSHNAPNLDNDRMKPIEDITSQV